MPASQLFINRSHKRVTEIVEKIIYPVLDVYGTNRSFKLQNTIFLKTGVFIKVSEIHHLH